MKNFVKVLAVLVILLVSNKTVASEESKDKNGYQYEPNTNIIVFDFYKSAEGTFDIRQNKETSAKFEQALSYLKKSEMARKVLKELKTSSEKTVLGEVIVAINSTCDDELNLENPRFPIVGWDPSCAVEDDGKKLSPAIGLIHEMVHYKHKIEDSYLADNNHDTLDAQYGNREERETIVFGENIIAKELGEPVRQNHNGIFYRVASPTER